MRLAPPPRSGARRHGGLTLIELIVAITVAAILFTWAIPSFQRFSARNEVAAEVMRIRTTLALARNTAVTRRTTISVCPRPTPGSMACDFMDWNHPLVVVEGQVASGDLSDGELLRCWKEVVDRPSTSIEVTRFAIKPPDGQGGIMAPSKSVDVMVMARRLLLTIWDESGLAVKLMASRFADQKLGASNQPCHG